MAYHSTAYGDVKAPSALGASIDHCPTSTSCWDHLRHQHRSISKFSEGINAQEQTALPLSPTPCASVNELLLVKV